MLIALTVLLVLTNAGFLVFLDRATRRHQEQVQALCQRVQAPQVAVMDHSAQQHQTVPGVSHALTDEQAAEQEEAARMIAELERQENDMLEARRF